LFIISLLFICAGEFFLARQEKHTRLSASIPKTAVASKAAQHQQQQQPL